jgi:hypothetical protein
VSLLLLQIGRFMDGLARSVDLVVISDLDDLDPWILMGLFDFVNQHDE